MNRIRSPIPLRALPLLALSLGACRTAIVPDPAPVAARTRPPAPPPPFVANHGQWPAPARFRARIAGAVTWLERDAIALQFRRAAEDDAAPATLVVRLRWPEASPHVELLGEGRLAGLHHFFLGDDPGRHRANVPGFAAVRYRDLHPGIDLRVREYDGSLEYDLLLAAGADLDRAVVAVEGAEHLTVHADGTLSIHTAFGELRQAPPRTWQVARDGSERAVPCRYRLLGSDRYGFAVDGADSELPTVIDPGLDWSTFLGGSAYEVGYAIAHEPSGAAVVTGETASTDFPTTAGAFDRTYNGFGAPSPDVFVTKIAADGRSLVFSTYLGGRDGDKPYEVAIDAAGGVTVVGNTASADFPTTVGAWQRTMRGRSDAFVSRLSTDGSNLIWSTYLGGNDGDVAQGLGLDSLGQPVVVGVTSSPDFPVTPGAFGTPPRGSSDVFVTRLRADGSGPLYSTLVGGSNGDTAQGVAVAADGTATVVGVTSSPDFPTTPGAYSRTPAGTSDAFVFRLDPPGANLRFSTLIGGSSGDVAEAAALEPSGATVVTGVTSSTDFPTTPGAYGRTASGSSDCFVVKFTPNADALLFSSLIGGSKGDVGKGVLLDHSGAAVVGGQTSSSDFPTTAGAYNSTAGGSADAFLSRVSPDGSSLLYSSYFGGSSSDGGEGVGGDGLTAALLVGVTNSSDHPTTPGAPGATLRGTNDAFAARLDIGTCGFTSYGTSTPACSGAIRIGVNRCPRAGDGAFALLGTNAPPGASGFLLLGFAPLPAGFPVAGILVHLDFTLPLLSVPTIAGPHGHANVGLPLTSVSSGAIAFFQMVWLNPPNCLGSGLLSASNALSLRVP